MKLIASVIIPTFNRQKVTERAIQSIINCNGSENVEIIIVDDCSKTTFTSPILRNQDSVLSMDVNSGPAKCRNRGIEFSKGEIIYLLDSDDYFVSRDFIKDNERVVNAKSLFYCNTIINKRKMNYPPEITLKDHFVNIFHRYDAIANTSSICFPSAVKSYFDIDLPKHEDWDFVNSEFLQRGRTVKLLEGLVYIDRSDKMSLSRKKNHKIELPWLEKIRKNYGVDNYYYAKYYLLSKYKECLSINEFLKISTLYILKRKISLKFVCKRLIQRFL